MPSTRSWAPPSSTARSPEPAVATLVASIFAAKNIAPVWAGDLGCLWSLGPLDYDELYRFIFSDTPVNLVWVVPDDGCLMDKHVTFSVIPGDEAIAVPDVEPLNSTVQNGS